MRRGPLPVMFVITSMPVGGAETLLADLVRGFDRTRIQPEIVCLKQRGPIGETLTSVCPVHAGMLVARWDLRVLPRLVSLFRKRRPAMVVTVGAGDKMFWGRLSAWIAGVPVITSALHSTGWPDGISRLNRALTSITDGFIAVANSHADHLRQRENLPADRVFTIRNGIDTNRFQRSEEVRVAVRDALGIAPETPLFGIVAALRPEKNHAMFLRTARRIISRHPGAHFLIVGDGPQRDAIQRIIDQTGLQSVVHMLGTRSETPQLLAAMDCFLLCSKNEASPVSILEALACQVPVISTRVGSVAESVLPAKTGFLVDVDDDAAMAENACALIENPALRQELGMRGRALVESQASLESMIRGYTELAEGLYDAYVNRFVPLQLQSDRRRHLRPPRPASTN
jgi:glycosyltransferase involved in cell wall biosynthesis